MQLPTFYEPSLTDADILYTLSEESQKHAQEFEKELKKIMDEITHLYNTRQAGINQETSGSWAE